MMTKGWDLSQARDHKSAAEREKEDGDDNDDDLEQRTSFYQ